MGLHYINRQFDKYRYKNIVQLKSTFSLKSTCVIWEGDIKGCFEYVPPTYMFSEYFAIKINSVAICSRLGHF